MSFDDYKNYIRLCAIPEIGYVSAMRLIDYFGSPTEIFEASKSELMQVEKVGERAATSIIENKNKIDLEKIRVRMESLGARYIHIGHPEYPKLLSNISDPPVGFYVIGNYDFSKPQISIIGSRNCSIYGQIIARKFATAFARAGFCVVSGMARGIDSFAHIGALEGKGETVAVLGCGADVIYPSENAELYNRIISNGAIVSEFPLGTRADRQNFPIRNRIVAGLSVATLVVESDVKGGSMITARLAAEQGRDVFAIPGRIDQISSRGCNALIRDGARLVTCPEEILEELAFTGQLEISFSNSSTTNKKTSSDIKPKDKTGKEKSDTHPQIKLSEIESIIYACLEKLEHADVDTISENTGLPPAKCLPTLTMLELKKIVAKDTGGFWKKRI